MNLHISHAPDHMAAKKTVAVTRKESTMASQTGARRYCSGEISRVLNASTCLV